MKYLSSHFHVNYTNIIDLISIIKLANHVVWNGSANADFTSQSMLLNPVTGALDVFAVSQRNACMI